MAKKSGRRESTAAAAVASAGDDPEGILTEAFGGIWRTDGPPDPQGRTRVVQFVPDEHGRSTVTGLIVFGGAITADYLRSLPVGAWENSHALSNRRAQDEVRAAIDGLPELRRSAGQTSEDFSRLLAQHYRAWAALVPHPARAIADRWQVPLPTVHGWVREARLRDLLPPGDRRKRAKGAADTKES